ncbi:MAG: hypothetical protein KIS66_11045 [Fimbriimonadaceae bacterium]|nr:hypothetical protein [Fimbriimonadaceae bacterium]
MIPILAVLLLAPPLVVRRGDVSIVPPEPLPLGGYTERRDAIALPGGDDLRARTIVLEQGTTRVALVSLDSLTVPGSLSREVRARLPSDVVLVLAATHTHCAPDSQMLNDRMTMKIPGIATYRPRWLEWYADRIAEGIREALVARPESGPLEWARWTPRYASGAWLNRARRPGAKPDPTAFGLWIGGRPLLGVFPAHPTLNGAEENRRRTDWPGQWARRSVLAPFVGAIGDVSPAPEVETADGAAKVEAFAHALQATMDKARRRAILRPSLSVSTAPVRLEKPSPSPAFVETNKVPEPLAALLVGKFAPTEATVLVIRLGEVALIAVPAEPTAEIGRAMVGDLAAATVIGFANEWIGYVLAEDDYARGGYEASLALHGPQTGRRLVEAAKQALLSGPPLRMGRLGSGTR